MLAGERVCACACVECGGSEGLSEGLCALFLFCLFFSSSCQIMKSSVSEKKRQLLFHYARFCAAPTLQMGRLHILNKTLALACLVAVARVGEHGAWAWHCPMNGEPGWADFCNGTVDTGSCKPYAPLAHDASPQAWLQARHDLQQAIFGGAPPTRSTPDIAPQPLPTPVTFGNCLCLLRGECTVDACSKPINGSVFGWTISQEVNSSFTLTLNSTVYHTLNSSGLAPDPMIGFDDGRAPTVRWPEVPMAPQRLSDTLVIFHDGHMVVSGCHYDDDGTMDWLNQLGFDAMHLQMPLHGCNLIPGEDPLHPPSHQWFEQFSGHDGAASGSFPFMRFFLEPVWLSINYARSLGYKNIVMAGLSGGGWTTTLMAGIDPRIGLSIPVAGSMPCDFAHTYVRDAARYGYALRKTAANWMFHSCVLTG